MAALSLPKTLPKAGSLLIDRISGLVPGVAIEAGGVFLWSPENNKVLFNESKIGTKHGQWSLLHEISHAALNHRSYKNDFELLQFEVAAWRNAKEVARTLDITIDQNFIEDCLDTYRDWLHQRSTCPTCGNGGLQHDMQSYRCHNCLSAWHVSQSRFCRPYRKKQVTSKTSSDSKSQTMFQ